MTPAGTADAAGSARERGSRPADNVRLSFRPDIEGLRGVAVLMVVAYHAGLPGFSGGFVGVDVFFVISGFLISGLLLEEYQRSATVSISRFYARRARRLLPAAFLMIVVTLVAARFLLSPLEFRDLGKAGLFAAGSSSNLWFAINANDYFGEEIANSSFIHTWSLAVEEQFYLLWPALILLLARSARSDRARRLCLAAVTLAGLAVCVAVTQQRQGWAFYLMPFRVWEFSAGALAYLYASRALPVFRGLLLAAGSLLVVGSAFFVDATMPFPGMVASVPVLGSCLLLMGYQHGSRSPVTRLLASRPLQVLGGVSYAWYLWHWPFLTLGAQALPAIPNPARAFLLVGASLAVAWVSLRLLEDPIRRHPRLLASTAASLVLGGALIVAGMAAGGTAYWSAKRALSDPLQVQIEKARDVPRSDCVARLTETQPKTCVVGDERATTTIALVGDSHAHQWLPALERIVSERRWRLVTFLKSACPTPDVAFYYPNLKRQYDECPRWREEMFAQLVAARPTMVVMAHASTGYVSDRPDSPSIPVEAWTGGLERSLARLPSVPVLLLRDNPRPDQDRLSCLSRAAFRGERLESACIDERRAVVDETVFAAERRVVEGRAHGQIIDFTDWFCSATECPSFRHGTVLYRDGNHLSIAAVLALKPALEERMTQILASAGVR